MTCRESVPNQKVKNADHTISQTWFKEINLIEKSDSKEAELYNGVVSYFKDKGIGSNGVLYNFDSPMLVVILGKLLGSEK